MKTCLLPYTPAHICLAVKVLASAVGSVLANSFAVSELRRMRLESFRLVFSVQPLSCFFRRLVRSYKAQYPGVKLALRELNPLQQEDALDKGLIDIGFARTLIA
jgi:DNA-binding transcriptional LysR family regulator